MNSVFVYCEIEEGAVADVSLELLTKGRTLASKLGVKLEAKTGIPLRCGCLMERRRQASGSLHNLTSYFRIGESIQRRKTSDCLYGCHQYRT